MGKMAQIGLMNVLAVEGKEHGILVNAISPVALGKSCSKLVNLIYSV